MYQTKPCVPDGAAIALLMACRDAMGDDKTMAEYEARRRATRSCSRSSRRSGASR